MREPRDGLDRRDACEIERALGFRERAERVFENSSAAASRMRRRVPSGSLLIFG
jgi:hypothetical protein